MLPGPTYVYECSQCHGLFSRSSISSGNTLRARYRSDGRMDAPMLPTTPLLSACPHCKTPVFWPKTKELAKYETYARKYFSTSEPDPKQLEFEKQQFELETQYKDAPQYTEVTATQMAEFLNGLQFSEKHEPTLRMQFWWVFNDERMASGREVLNAEERENLKKLLQLLGQENDSMMLLSAEIYRELGVFLEAKRCLDYDFKDHKAAMAEQLMLAIEKENTLPFRFASSDSQYDYEYAWIERRYSSEDPSKYNFADLKPPVFKISNRDWWVKVLGMLSHNWALIEKNADSTATIYFFQDHAPRERPAIIDSLEFSEEIEAWGALKHNGFTLLKDTPGPWMGDEPKGHFYDARPAAGKGIYSGGTYWKDDYYGED